MFDFIFNEFFLSSRFRLICYSVIDVVVLGLCLLRNSGKQGILVLRWFWVLTNSRSRVYLCHLSLDLLLQSFSVRGCRKELWRNPAIRGRRRVPDSVHFVLPPSSRVSRILHYQDIETFNDICMEVRSELGILSGGDSFGVSIQQSPTPSPSPMMQNMRMAFGGEGAAVYRPVSGSSAPASYHGASGELPAAKGLSLNPGQPVKRKRGRPRKFDSDGTMAIGLSSAPALSSAAAGAVAGSSTGFSLSYAPAAATLAPESSLQLVKMKKARGRPPGSTNKHQINALGSGGVGFNPHVITVKAGEDVSAKIMSFSHSGPRAVCILSANGAISNVTLRQAATSGGTVTYEGRFEILSLSGSFLLSESAGQRSRTGGLSVSLAGPDGRVLGGGVAGLLTAASPVQVVVGSFIADGGRKEEQQINPLDVSPAPGKLPPGMPGPSSPPSRGTLSESSGGGPGSPFNQSINDNNNQQSLPNMSWK